jgi:hypothetical protein
MTPQGDLRALSKIGDGTNIAAVKAPSVAAIAGDPALVVAINPLSNLVTLGTGSNTIGNTNQTLATAEFAKITDGNNTATVKAANTTAVGGDQALVVAFNPLSNRIASDGALGTSVGTVGSLVGGAVSTTAPVYVNGNFNQLSLDLSGNLRTVNRISDGTNFSSIKPASTNALATDTAEVVTLRPQTTTNFGAVSPVADTLITPVSVRIRGLLFTNNNAFVVYVGIYNSAAALTGTSVPFNGYAIRVPANATLDKSVADFGETGRLFGANTHIGLSSTLGVYTALTAPQLALCSLNVETIN